MIKDKEKIWKRVYLIYFSILLLALFIIIKIIYIQVADGEEMMAKAKEQSLQYITIDATRGNIYSIDGSLIATSVPVFEIRLDLDSSTVSSKLFDKDIDSLSYCLADFFKDKTKDEYKSILINEREKQNRYYLLKKELDPDNESPRYILSENTYSSVGIAISAGKVGSGNAWFVSICFGSPELVSEIQMLNL